MPPCLGFDCCSRIFPSLLFTTAASRIRITQCRTLLVHTPLPPCLLLLLPSLVRISYPCSVLLSFRIIAPSLLHARTTV